MTMRLFGKLAATAIGAGTLALAVPGPAYASSTSVSPGTVAPGGTITVHITCDSGTNETIEALWGSTGSNAQGGDGSVTLSGGSGSTTFTIPTGTAAGPYFAGAFCPGATHGTYGFFTVSPTGAPRGGTGLADHTPALALAGAGALAAAGAAAGLLMWRRTDAPLA